MYEDKNLTEEYDEFKQKWKESLNNIYGANSFFRRMSTLDDEQNNLTVDEKVINISDVNIAEEIKGKIELRKEEIESIYDMFDAFSDLCRDLVDYIKILSNTIDYLYSNVKLYTINFGYGYAYFMTPYHDEVEKHFLDYGNKCFGLRKSISKVEILDSIPFPLNRFENDYIEKLSFNGDVYIYDIHQRRKMIEPEWAKDEQWIAYEDWSK